MYECWNANCPNYAGHGFVLGNQHVRADAQNYLHCAACGAYVRRRANQANDEATKGVAGAAGGALLGWAVGGPPGALIGALLGGLVGASSGSKGS